MEGGGRSAVNIREPAGDVGHTVKANSWENALVTSRVIIHMLNKYHASNPKLLHLIIMELDLSVRYVG